MPQPASESTSIVAPIRRARSVRSRSPNRSPCQPEVGSNPSPSSWTSSVTASRSYSSPSLTDRARACLTMLVSASRATSSTSCASRSSAAPAGDEPAVTNRTSSPPILCAHAASASSAASSVWPFSGDDARPSRVSRASASASLASAPACRSRSVASARSAPPASAACAARVPRSPSALSRCTLMDTSRWARLSCTSPRSRSRSAAVASARARSSAASCMRAVASAIAACLANSSSSSASSGPNTRRSSLLNTTHAPMMRPRHSSGTPMTPRSVARSAAATWPPRTWSYRSNQTGARLATTAPVIPSVSGKTWPDWQATPMSASLRYVPAASSTLQIEPAVQPSSSVQRSRMRSSSGRSENSPARSSATAISPAALAAAPYSIGDGSAARRSADTGPPNLRQLCHTEHGPVPLAPSSGPRPGPAAKRPGARHRGASTVSGQPP